MQGAQCWCRGLELQAEQRTQRFGDDEMPEMEDAFRNLFEALGDTVLKLRQKTIAGGTDMARLGVSLGDLAGAS